MREPKIRKLSEGTLTTTLDVKFEQSELMCRLIEVMIGRSRPAGLTALQALDVLRAGGQEGEAAINEAAELAHVALEYVTERMNEGLAGYAEMGRVPDKDELQ